MRDIFANHYRQLPGSEVSPLRALPKYLVSVKPRLFPSTPVSTLFTVGHRILIRTITGKSVEGIEVMRC